MNYETELQQTLEYLHSEDALRDVSADPYWPKWDSPWWHMLLLHEMGKTKLIPRALIEAFVASFNKIPEGTCLCQLGCVYQVLAEWGLNVDSELPWIRPWLLRYQMEDGGLNCDSDAYLVKNEIPSSMVGTIAVFEAILLYTPRAWTPEEETFLNRAAQFLMDRQLINGSMTKYNASERESAKEWIRLCFPRFYFYDVLRGLNALFIWSEKTNKTLPSAAFQEVLVALRGRFPDGVVQNERLSYAGVNTILLAPSGEWVRQQPATVFPLLTKVSEVGAISPFLSRQWSDTENRLLKRRAVSC
jgi:hypothetical protein